MKKKKKGIIAGIIALAVVGGLVGATAIKAKNAVSMMEEESTFSAVAYTGNISATIEGVGALSAGGTTNIKAPVGIKIAKVYVRQGDPVKKDQVLAEVDQASVADTLLSVRQNIRDIKDDIAHIKGNKSDKNSDAYLKNLSLSSKLAQLEEAEKMLSALIDDPKIKATADGYLSAVNVKEDMPVTQSSGSDGGSDDGMPGGDEYPGGEEEYYGGGVGRTSVSFVMLSSAPDNAAGEAENDPGMTVAEDPEDLPGDDEGTGNEGTEPEGTEISSKCLVLDIREPIVGERPQEEVDETVEYEKGEIKWKPGDAAFKPNTVYMAKVKLTANEGYFFSEEIKPVVEGSKTISEMKVSDDKKTLEFTITYAKTLPSAEAAEKKNKKEDELKPEGDEEVPADEADIGGGGGGYYGGGGDDGSSPSGNYAIDQATVFVIASNETMTVTINVDELDILAIREGQSAKIRLDAIPEGEFEGTITKISNTTSNNNGSSKYPIQVSIDKTDDMRLGMSASVTIYMDERDDAILIPIGALQERSGQSFVYTGQDADGNPTDEVEVEVGLSNDSEVEILSGLSDGDTVYYLKNDMLNDYGWMEDDVMVETEEVVTEE